MKGIIYILGSILVLTSCGNVSLKSDGRTADSITVANISDSMPDGAQPAGFAYDSAYCAELSANVKRMSDVDRIGTLANSSFWASDSLSREQSLLLMNYLIEHQESDKDAAIADFMFEYFQSEEHFKNFDSYFKLYSDASILESLTFEIMSAWSNENESISEDDFKSKFKYLYDNDCLKYFKTFTSLEK